MAIPDALSRHFVGYKNNKDEKKDYMTNCFEKIIDLVLNEMSKSRAMLRQKKKKKKKNRGFKIQLSEFSIFCCSVYSCGWLPQKILWKPLHSV